MRKTFSHRLKEETTNLNCFDAVKCFDPRLLCCLFNSSLVMSLVTASLKSLPFFIVLVPLQYLCVHTHNMLFLLLWR